MVQIWGPLPKLFQYSMFVLPVVYNISFLWYMHNIISSSQNLLTGCKVEIPSHMTDTREKIIRHAMNMSFFKTGEKSLWSLLLHWSLLKTFCLAIFSIETWVTIISWRSSPGMSHLAGFSFLRYWIVLVLPFQAKNLSAFSKCNHGYCHD